MSPLTQHQWQGEAQANKKDHVLELEISKK